MKNYLIIDPAVPTQVAQDFNTHFEKWLTQEIFPMLISRLGTALPTPLSTLSFEEEDVVLGACRVRFVVIPGRQRTDFIPLQNKVNTVYLNALDAEFRKISSQLAKCRNLADYPFWATLPGTLDKILTDLQGDVTPATVTQIRMQFAAYFSLEQAAHLRQKPGIHLFKSLLSILLILDRIFVLPQSVLGNFLPQDLLNENYSTIEIYSDAIASHGANTLDVLFHEFFHFVHYACIKASQGRWLSYNKSFQEDLAVVESLARYIDGTPESLGVFPGNPYFGANYLKLFELLSDDTTPVHYRDSTENPQCFQGELGPREVNTINTLYRQHRSQLTGNAFQQAFSLSLTDMSKAYHFIEAIRHLCLTRIELGA
ncbi:MAG: hypothetical protein RR614_05060 [Eubacterium sp.]